MDESFQKSRIEVPPNLKNSHAEDSYAHPFLDDAVEIITGKKTKPVPSEILQDVAMTLEGRFFNKLYHGEKNDAVADYFKKIFYQANVLDLGCGVQAAGYRIADFSNAKKYVGIEKNFGKAAFEATSQLRGKTPFQIIQEEMINYLGSSGKNFDVILLVGITSSIVPRQKQEGLLKLIFQKLSKNGKLLTSHIIRYTDGVKTMFEIDPDYEKLIQENEGKIALRDDKTNQKIARRAVLPLVWKKLSK